jgi:hypothetical protein
MPKYDMILQEMKYSHSSINTFDHCQYAFLQLYINAESRANNFFGEYGKFCHRILEKYFKDEIDIWQLPVYYARYYKKGIKSSCPTYPKGMAEKYYEQGLFFFENFEFDKSKYEIIGIEKKLQTKYKDIKFVLVPDLILKDKETNEYILYDYKTANLFKNNRLDKKKLEDYKNQINLYTYFIWLIKEIQISKIKIWAIRNNATIDIDYDPIQVLETVEWIENTVAKIKKEEEWKANTSEPYFCYNICSNRFSCPFISGNSH